MSSCRQAATTPAHANAMHFFVSKHVLPRGKTPPPCTASPHSSLLAPRATLDYSARPSPRAHLRPISMACSQLHVRIVASASPLSTPASTSRPKDMSPGQVVHGGRGYEVAQAPRRQQRAGGVLKLVEVLDNHHLVQAAAAIRKRLHSMRKVGCFSPQATTIHYESLLRPLLDCAAGRAPLLPGAEP